MTLNLPYSVTRGEQVVIQAIVFNYMQQDQDVSALGKLNVFDVLIGMFSAAASWSVCST